MSDAKPRPPHPDTLSDPMAPAGPHDGSTASYRPAPGVSGVYAFLDPPSAPGEVGQLGKYRVQGVIGQGGMGVVFRAVETGLGRVVALKVMLPQYAGNALAKARFVREGRAAAAVEHDHILPIFAVDESRGVPYIAMPLLKGMSLSDALKAAPRPPLSEVLRVGREVAEGLAAAHEKGLIHRDIKPANVWLEGNRRRVKILDFGLARAGEDVVSPDEPKTQSGAVVGTPMYMSPEQGNGDPVDARTDLWSLGVVLYEMTTGRRPFTAKTTMAVLSALANHHPPPPNAVVPECPPDLAALVTVLLAKHPGQRPGSAAWVAEELGRIEQGLSVMMAEPVPLAEAAADPWAVISAATEPAALPAAAEEPSGSRSTAPSRAAPRGGRTAPLAWAAGGVAVLVLAGAAAVLMRPKPEPRAEATDPAPPTTARKTPPTTRKPTDPGPKPADLPAPPPADPAFFNGKDLAGWVADPPAAWEAKDGALRLVPTEARARIHTAARYTDFDLAFRLKGTATVGGRVWFRAEPTPGPGNFFTGTPLFVDRDAFNLHTPRPARGPRPKRDWHDVRIRCVGPRVHVVVNGLTVADDEFDTPAEGVIGFTALGGQQDLVVADVRFADLSKPAAVAAPFFNGKDLAGWEVTDGEWAVEGGELVGRKTGDRPAVLVSRGEFQNFDLSFDFLQTPAADADTYSVLSFWSDGRVDVQPKVSFGGPTTGTQSSRAKSLVSPPADVVRKALKPTGYNHFRVAGRDGTARCWVNGTLLTETTYPVRRAGMFSWYVHGKELRVRNVRFVTPTDAPADPPP